MSTTRQPPTSIGLGQLRGNTCGYVQRVVSGETFYVLRRGRLVAQISAAREEPSESHHNPVLPVHLGHLRTQASRYLDRVVAGETIEIIHRGCAVARIYPCAPELPAKPGTPR